MNIEKDMEYVKKPIKMGKKVVMRGFKLCNALEV